MADLRDILSDNDEHLNEDAVNEDDLLRYLEGSLSEEDKQAFESKIKASGFVNDAVDGLKTVKNKNNINDYVHQLNKNLEKQLALKKHHKEKRTIKYLPWVILAALVILIVCVIAYVVIHYYRNS
jgi:ABC-type bacteriocin/lantibiotic exporter with double-glycine peptidase domain